MPLVSCVDDRRIRMYLFRSTEDFPFEILCTHTRTRIPMSLHQLVSFYRALISMNKRSQDDESGVEFLCDVYGWKHRYSSGQFLHLSRGNTPKTKHILILECVYHEKPMLTENVGSFVPCIKLQLYISKSEVSEMIEAIRKMVSALKKDDACVVNALQDPSHPLPLKWKGKKCIIT